MTPTMDAGAKVPDFIPTINIDSGTVFLTCKEGHRLSISTTIERLIDMLDAMEPDPDLEPYLGSGDDREGEDGYAGEADLEPSLGWATNGQHGQNANFASDWGDLEADNADNEPSLGAPETRFAGVTYCSTFYGPLAPSVAPIGSQEQWAIGGRDDREDDGDDREPDKDEELSLGWENEGSQATLQAANDDETELGWPEQVDQVRRVGQAPSTFLCPDGEPDLGFVGHGTGWRNGEGVDDREQAYGADDEREGNDEREPNGDEGDYSRSEDDCLPVELHSIPLHHPDGGGSVSQFDDGWRPARGSGVAPAMVEKAKRLPSGDIVRMLAEPEEDVSKFAHIYLDSKNRQSNTLKSADRLSRA